MAQKLRFKVTGTVIASNVPGGGVNGFMMTLQQLDNANNPVNGVLPVNVNIDTSTEFEVGEIYETELAPVAV